MKYLALLIFVVLSIVYYFISFGSEDFSQVFLTISTFLFAIFTGFFISRQGRRYSAIRDQITKFDGEMSSIYRKFGHLGKEPQESVKEIIHDHYEKILTHKAWDYHFVNPSNTITACHRLLDDVTKDKAFPTLQNFATQRILVSLENVQVARKSMVALHQERIPRFQWVLVYFLAVILLITVSTIPSEGFLFGSILKSAFSSSVLFVVILLHAFDQLRFFGGTIGERSAKDLLEIFVGKN